MRQTVFISLLLTVLVAVTFWGVRWHGFSNYDDTIHITENQYMRPPSLERTWFFWRFPFDRTPVEGIRNTAGGINPPYQAIYAPLAFTTWSALTYLARDTTSTETVKDDVPLDASVYHSFNLLLHLMNTVLVFLLVKRLVGNEWAALAGALVFGLHPVQVEPVAWVTGMNNLLGGLLSLLALHCYLFATGVRGGLDVEEAKQAPRLRLGWYVASTLFFALAVLGKPSSVPLPLVAFLLTIALHPLLWRRRLVELLPWCLISLAVVAINQTLNTADLSVARVAWYQRPLLVGDALAFYLGKLVVPFPLTSDYGRKPAWVMAQTATYFLWLVPVLATVVLFWMVRARSRANRMAAPMWRLAWVAWLLFLLTLLPTSGVITFYFHLISTVADRYLYVALIPLSIGIGAILAPLLPTQAPRLRWGLAALGVLLCGVWMGLSRYQAGLWSSDDILWSHTLRYNPRSVTSLSILAGNAGRAENWDTMRQYVARGLEEDPNHWRLLGYQGSVYKHDGQLDKAEASFRRSLELNSNYLGANLGLGEVLMEKGDNAGAIAAFGAALKINPQHPQALAQFGLLAGKMGSPKIAEKYLREALVNRFNPGAGHTFLGIALAQQGRYAEAMDELNLAISFNANLYEAHYNRGLLVEREGDLVEAGKAFGRTMELKPDFVPAYLSAARVEERRGRKELANRLWTAALRLDPDNRTAKSGLGYH